MKKLKIMINKKKIKEIIKNYFKDPLFLRRWEYPYYTRQDDNQISVRITGCGRGWKYSYRGDSHMFIEDMYVGIMPFMIYKGESEKYPIYIEPKDTTKERIIARGISGNRGFLGDALCDFVRSTTQTLFQKGEILYELIYKKNEQGEIEEFGLRYLSSCCLFKIFGNYYQIVPWWIASKSNVKVGIYKIPCSKVLKIDFPKELGGKRKIKKIIKRLWYLGKNIFPEFYMESMKNNENTSFNLNDYTNSKYIEIARLTKKFGWNQRKLSDGYITEYYSMVRQLRNKKAEIIIRDKIINDLNKYLNGEILNFNIKIIYENFHTIQNIKEQEERLKKGNVEFMDIFNKTKL